ncbi:MAG: hypothetical protein AAGA74_16180 [Pseudomonadota bacterium]
MFRDLWEERNGSLADRRKEQRKAIKAHEAKINKLTDRLIDTDSPSVIRAMETKLETLESELASMQEKLAQSGKSLGDFDVSFRTAMSFLANPCKLWDSEHIEDRKAVLRLVFAAPLPYARNEGFRTAKTTISFKVLGGISTAEKEVADPRGFEPLASAFGAGQMTFPNCAIEHARAR